MLQVTDQHIKLPVECRLLLRVKFDLKVVAYGRWLITKFNKMAIQNFFFEFFCRNKIICSHIFLYQPVIVIIPAGFIFLTIIFSL